MIIKWQVASEVLSSKIDDEAILMSFEADSYFGLNSVGSRIWEILSGEAKTIDELVSILIEEYEVGEKQCREEVERFIEDMVGRKLIKPCAKHLQ
jgi:hypothetical protein